MSQRENWKVYFMLIVTMIFWGLSFIWYKQALPIFTPVTIIFLRMIISAPLLFCFAYFIGRLKKIQRKDIKMFLSLAFFEPFLYFMAESNGLKYVSSSLASIIIATIPLFTLFTAYYFFNERLTYNNYTGIFLSFIGAVVVIYADGIFGQVSATGIVLMFIAVLSTLGYTAILKKLSSEYGALTIVGYQNLIGSIYTLPFFLMQDFNGLTSQNLTLKNLLPVIYLSVFASTIAFILFVRGIKKIGIAKSMVFTNFIPVVTAVLAVYMLNEGMGILKAAGIFLTVMGLMISQSGNFSRIRIYSRIKR
ncbi:MAG: DMT family transporter [Bacteroidales bacterium]|nr:DMT family transporter [Bacteroidales bacterium]